MSTVWKIDQIINFQKDKRWGNGYAQFGFHDGAGRQYVVDFWKRT
jgi:hypothetical protein